MSQKPDADAETPTPPEEADAADEARSESLFFRTLERDVWEAWTWAALGLAVNAAIIWAVAYLRLGHVSVYAYGVGIPLTGMLALPVIFWGLVKTMFNPPVFRISRTVGFLLLLTVSWLANSPMFAAPVSTEGWRSEHAYRLPFDGTWYTLAGGPELETNHLATAPASRFGYEFTRLGPEGKRYQGDDELDRPSYYCWGEPVLAPVAGEVIERYDSQEDNVPGKSSQKNMLGNHVVLRVDEGEFLVTAMLQQDSVPVQVGDRVEPGDRIGACGNSGASLYPHVRMYLVRDAEKLILTEGLPLRFQSYEVAGGDRVVEGMPTGAPDPQAGAGGQSVRPFDP